LQVAQSLQPVTKALAHLLTLILFGFPLILFFASLGGLFLADRALSPINRIIRTAEAINSDDLSYRINYQGVSDEVGRLAMTFDRMLNRIELAFEHERRFIADASHELRTPLTIIKGKIGVILSRQRTPAEYEAVLRDLDSETDRLVRLTNGLLFLTRLEQEQLQGKEDFVTVDLSSLLEILIEQIQLTKNGEIDLQVEIMPNLCILGNSDLLTSLFLNILDNAIKYTPPGEKICLTTQLNRQQKQIIVAIANTGAGIATEDLPYLFNRFYRLDRDRASHNQGSGLGLAIAALIARCHGGEISVTSKIDDLTTFEVILPSSVASSQE
jgi:signal transduction histidine kinase